MEKLLLLLLAVFVTLVSQMHAKEDGKAALEKTVSKDRDAEWEDVVDCFKILTNKTSISTSTSVPPAQVTRDLFKAICGTKEQFLACVDSSLDNADSNSVVRLFRPLFNVSLVTQAYDDLCSNLTVTGSDEDLSCLINSTALLPCYNQYYNYIFYLSVVKRFGSAERQLSDEILNTLLCTLAEERRDCEVAALNVCSTKIGHVMQSFYQKTLPSACNEDDIANTDAKEGTPTA